jgi:predicted ATPase/DNA-binding winged helix-turn-helix (wHTH) protein
LLADSVRFEDRYELQPRERRLLVDGTPTVLGARAFDVLLALVERAGELVSKNDLLEQVWTGRVVEEANLTVQVSSLRKVLGGELIATIPGRGYRFTGRTSHSGAAVPDRDGPPPASVFTPGAAPPPARAAAPAITLVGRGADLDHLRTALANPGCVTLVGPAGVGKTSLARAVAAAWPAGAVWVDLAPLAEPPQVMVALAMALGLPAPLPDNAAALLLRALGERLLVLDNAEHLIDAAATLVAQLTQAQPALALLVTCQLPLSVPHERVQRVEPLALGDDLQAGALALFVERARAADHRFAPATGHLPLLQAICRQLDGLPLALEMAAARVPALGLKGLHEALEQRFAVLTRGARTAAQRHRTLQAALDWSHGLLQPEEQRLFRALGVFAGGFTLDLAVAVAVTVAGDARHERWALIDTLASLVDRSLVTADTGGDVDAAPRYRLLETQRAYAIERLGEAGELPALRLRHAQAMLGLFETARSSTSDQQRMRALAIAEHDNAREAIAWATRHAPAIAVPLAPSVCITATFTAWRLEALRWLEASEPALAHEGVDPVSLARWWTERSRQLLMSERPEAAAMAERARGYCLAGGDARTLFLVDSTLVRAQGVPDDLLATVIAELQAIHDAHPEWQPRSTMVMHGALAVACARRNDLEGKLHHGLAELEAARAFGLHVSADAAETNVIGTLNLMKRHEEALARSQALLARLGNEDSGNLPWVWSTHVNALVGLGRHAEVRTCARQVWALLQRYERPLLAGKWTEMLSNEGRHEDAARVTGFLLQTCEAKDIPTIGETRRLLDAAEAVSRPALGSERWLRHVDEGRSFDATRAFACLGASP